MMPATTAESPTTTSRVTDVLSMMEMMRLTEFQEDDNVRKTTLEKLTKSRDWERRMEQNKSAIFMGTFSEDDIGEALHKLFPVSTTGHIITDKHDIGIMGGDDVEVVRPREESMEPIATTATATMTGAVESPAREISELRAQYRREVEDLHNKRSVQWMYKDQGVWKVRKKKTESETHGFFTWPCSHRRIVDC